MPEVPRLSRALLQCVKLGALGFQCQRNAETSKRLPAPPNEPLRSKAMELHRRPGESKGLGILMPTLCHITSQLELEPVDLLSQVCRKDQVPDIRLAEQRANANHTTRSSRGTNNALKSTQKSTTTRSSLALCVRAWHRPTSAEQARRNQMLHFYNDKQTRAENTPNPEVPIFTVSGSITSGGACGGDRSFVAVNCYTRLCKCRMSSALTLAVGSHKPSALVAIAAPWSQRKSTLPFEKLWGTCTSNHCLEITFTKRTSPTNEDLYTALILEGSGGCRSVCACIVANLVAN